MEARNLVPNASGYCAIEMKADSWGNVSYSNNHYGSSEPSCDVGAPRQGC
ncbi:MAG: hypothetical protein ABEN55_15695 [Bradymonadaceae bacterium]